MENNGAQTWLEIELCWNFGKGPFESSSVYRTRISYSQIVFWRSLRQWLYEI
jgi:hypothetical protein